MSARVSPGLDWERERIASSPAIIALDEVGRGALAGPVAVGAVALGANELAVDPPDGLRDSKLVPAARRPDLARRSASWVAASAVGWADAAEVDRLGIIAALGVAAQRALADLHAHGVGVRAAAILLDGSYDYISPIVPGLRVFPVVKADRDCASAAAASVIAKHARDALMVDLHPEYEAYAWNANKGYASAAHRDAIARVGPSRLHRLTWLRPQPDRIS